MEKSIWKKRVREDTSVKGLGSCNRVKRGVYAKKGEGVFIVEGRERGVQAFVEDQLRKGYI